MIYNDFSKKLLASKKLSRTRIEFKDDILELDVLWCRTAYNKNENWTLKTHRHTFYEMQFVLTGDTIMSINDKKDILFKKGDFLMIPPKINHQIKKVSDDFSKFVFGFNISFNDDNMDSQYLKSAYNSLSDATLLKSSPNMFDICNLMLTYSFEQNPGYVTAVSKLLELLIIETANSISPNSQNYLNDKNEFEQDIRIDSIYKYINDNIHTQITVEDISRQIHISEKQINRICKKDLGKNIGEIIKECKIAKIKSLLKTTNLSLREISEKVGYSNEFNLIRFFKNQEGLSPGKYRESLKMT